MGNYEIHGLDADHVTKKVLKVNCSYEDYEKVCNTTSTDLYHCIALISFKRIKGARLMRVMEKRYK